MGEVDAAGFEGLGCAHGKAALGEVRRAFHEDDDRVSLDLLFDAFVDVHWRFSRC